MLAVAQGRQQRPEVGGLGPVVPGQQGDDLGDLSTTQERGAIKQGTAQPGVGRDPRQAAAQHGGVPGFVDRAQLGQHHGGRLEA
jgi:hypothetical protein